MFCDADERRVLLATPSRGAVTFAELANNLAALDGGRPRCSRLPPLKLLGAMIKKYLAEIIESFRSKLDNSLAEATNGRVQAAKIRANSYAPTPI